MAETKTFNTRIQIKADTYANWMKVKDTFVPLENELCAVIVPAQAGAVAQEPAVLFKLGDGVKTFGALSFTSSIAADVYDWAKAESKPTYAASEIDGLADYIAGKVEDTDTQYKIEQDDADRHILKFYSKALGGDWVLATTITTPDAVYDDGVLSGRISELENLVGSDSVASQISAAVNAYKTVNDEAVAAAKKAGDDAQEAVDSLTEKVGSVTDGKTVVQMIEEAKVAATYDDAEIRGLISGNTDGISDIDGKINVLIGDDSGKSARTIANEELAKQLIPENADESLDTLAEIAAWIQEHPDDASAMNAAIAALEAKVDVGDKTVGAYVADAVDALKIGDYAKAADLTALAARVVTAETEIAKKVNDADLAAVAKSGNVNDLVQTAGDYIIFNCGSSSEVI